MTASVLGKEPTESLEANANVNKPVKAGTTRTSKIISIVILRAGRTLETIAAL